VSCCCDPSPRSSTGVCVCACPPVSRGSVSIARYQSLNLTPDDIPSIPWTRNTTPPDPTGGLREGFPTSPCILVGIPWQLLFRQFHNLGTCPIRSSSQFRGGGCSDVRRAGVGRGVWVIGDRHPAHLARVQWRSGNQVPISNGETRRPHSMCAKARARIQYGLVTYGEWTDTRVKVMNVSRGFVLSPPGGGFEPKTFVS
jgi:hypothetical protein